ncbi:MULTISPECIES: hypothetical protein [Candidatus Ichthyocystis]|uniref:Putative exported protein n=1 Tax=Candidatus Ichthyocystis hellenicum TaxID=1561003 RepID=A0A0S4M3T3_9BURK|nr:MULTISPECIES: hypothetical protein [Ichthyocystis]CUT16966.1 putative exported protein [Candidatus Ichthyocystis hellenicum]
MRTNSPSFTNEKVKEETTDEPEPMSTSTPDSPSSTNENMGNHQSPYLGVTTESKIAVVMKTTNPSKSKIKREKSIAIMSIGTPQTKRVSTIYKGYNLIYPSNNHTNKTAMLHSLGLIISSTK